MTEIKMPKAKALEIENECIVKENLLEKEFEKMSEKWAELGEEASRKYVAELLNNLLQYVSNMTFLRLGNIEIWTKEKQLIDLPYDGIEGGVREEYRIVRWVNKDEPRGSN